MCDIGRKMYMSTGNWIEEEISNLFVCMYLADFRQIQREETKRRYDHEGYY